MLDLQLKEFEMNKINFIVDVNDFLNNNLIVEKHISFSLKIDSIEAFRKLDYKHFFISKNTSHFSFVFDEFILDNFNENDIYFLISFLFHPLFLKLNNKPIFFFNKMADNESVKTIKNKIIKQGFSDCFIKNIQFEITLNKSNVKNQYLNLLNNDFLVNHFVHLHITQFNEIGSVAKELLEAENELKQNNPKLFQILFKTYKLENDLINANLELFETKEDLENQKIYLEFFKNQDEAKKINDFYYHEYEVLPLWYKQFGHIIKAILGKRTWRSLWDNNSKNNFY